MTDVIKLLVVDDKPELRVMLKLAFHNRDDYEIAEAEDGEEALKSIARNRPDLVLLDIMMPGPIDGLGVLDIIRGDPKYAGMKIFMLSARGQDRDVAIGMEKGADSYFIKPFSIIALRDAIDRIFDRQAQAGTSRP